MVTEIPSLRHGINNIIVISNITTFFICSILINIVSNHSKASLGKYVERNWYRIILELECIATGAPAIDSVIELIPADRGRKFIC